MARVLVMLLTMLSVAPLVGPADGIRVSAAGQAAAPTSACALLTKDVLQAHTPAAPEIFKVMTSVPPQEDKVGVGTACSFGGVTLQVDVFAPATFEKTFSQFTPLSGVGDKAYFRANRDRYAELGVLSGKRVITLQMSAPNGKTPADVQPNVVALAKAILAKMK
jgi:hypothetical protein